MSDAGLGTGKQAKGGVKVGVMEKADTKTSPKEKEKFEVEWRVLLHNDDVHTFDYVSRKLAEVRLSFAALPFVSILYPQLRCKCLYSDLLLHLIFPPFLPPYSGCAYANPLQSLGMHAGRALPRLFHHCHCDQDDCRGILHEAPEGGLDYLRCPRLEFQEGWGGRGGRRTPGREEVE